LYAIRLAGERGNRPGVGVIRSTARRPRSCKTRVQKEKTVRIGLDRHLEIEYTLTGRAKSSGCDERRQR